MTESLLPKYSGVRVLTIGDVILDRYWTAATERISPEAPVPVGKIDAMEDRVGGAGNVALNIAALGCDASLVGVTGDDAEAEVLLRLLNDNAIDPHLVKHASCKTTTKIRVLSRNQQLIRLDFDHQLQEESILPDSKCLQRVKECDALILSDYGKGALADTASLIAAAKEAGVVVFVDPKGADFSRYHGATVVTPNFSEFTAVVGPCKSEKEVEQKGFALCEQLDLQALLVTRSEKGMTLILRSGEVVHQHAQVKEVYDVTGAGDTVIAVFAASIAAGSDFKQAVSLANTAAGIVVAKLGAATVTAEELNQQLLHDAHQAEGIVTPEFLKSKLEAMRSTGSKIVMTNGCFDLLHVGHVRFLEAARARGDQLIVAVNSDDSVKRLKGDQRPINTLMDRMLVLAALRSVDWVVAFDEDTPQELICSLLPDLLVKGGDYQVSEIAGADCVLENGGAVEVLDFHAGYSTTSMIGAVKK